MYRHSIQAQQLLMNDASITNKAYCSLKRTIYTALLYILCIYLDVVASNYATNRWNTQLSHEQKSLPLPDILHDNFALPIDADHIIHELLRELPLFLLGAILVLGFVLPYDILGYNNTNYRRYEASTRYFETRCLLEVMRACSVWVTSQADPHGLHCMNIESHDIDNIFTNFTFARCGDNLYSGHVSNMLSLAIAIQTYMINGKKKKTKESTMDYLQLLATFTLWSTVLVVSIYVVVSRMHYTVDVLVSTFLVPLTWLAWSNVSWPTPPLTTEEERRGSSSFKAKNSLLDFSEHMTEMS